MYLAQMHEVLKQEEQVMVKVETRVPVVRWEWVRGQIQNLVWEWGQVK
jgi:hypothetical protein